uniref:DUF6824 domain-containing protein n=1 Tax=Amphora coffeiformis TaxID=265554 RepID=A0A7S3LGQ8_9STRA|mmetsp:Transcript_2481/g.5248  ORF Transcript_2481/g.5248 Transcript_2481/m.5248 type:complete len:299 (+) Transcript_2481:96-992(+)
MVQQSLMMRQLTSPKRQGESSLEAYFGKALRHSHSNINLGQILLCTCAINASIPDPSHFAPVSERTLSSFLMMVPQYEKMGYTARTKNDTMEDDKDAQPRGFSLPGGYTEFDILQGRGKGVLKHKGNQRFRKIIKRYNNAYARAQSNLERRKIVDLVLGEVSSWGRFLELQKDSDAVWVELSESKVREKVSQALRYQQRLRSAGLDTDSRSDSSSATEGEVGGTENSEPAPASAHLLEQPEGKEEQEDLQSLNEWDLDASPTASRPLVSDAEILLSIGAGHLVQEQTDFRNTNFDGSA